MSDFETLLHPGEIRESQAWRQDFGIEATLSYELNGPATFLLNVLAARQLNQRVEHEELLIDPALETTHWTDAQSGTRTVRFVAPPGAFSILYRAQVERLITDQDYACSEATPAESLPHLPKWAYGYLNPSRYCQSDQLGGFAYRMFNVDRPSYEIAAAICGWIAQSIAYQPGVSNPQTTAVETLANGAGVCRDFAHLAIALCRGLGMPARYVSVYSPQLQWQDFHAIVEVYCGGLWLPFDPTGMSDGREFVRIGMGLDAAQIPFSAFFGNGALTSMSVACWRSS